jgi:hypothetical protein
MKPPGANSMAGLSGIRTQGGQPIRPARMRARMPTHNTHDSGAIWHHAGM